jgi:hypothetical protein
MTALSRDAILAARDCRREAVRVPEWGGTVFVKVMSGADRDAFEQSVQDRRALGKVGENMRALVVVHSVVDDAGKQLFTEADLDALGAKNYLALDRIVNAALRLNKLNDEQLEADIKN